MAPPASAQGGVAGPTPARDGDHPGDVSDRRHLDRNRTTTGGAGTTGGTGTTGTRFRHD